MIVTIAFLTMLYFVISAIGYIDRLPDHHDID